jgi:uncharacterized cupredoxin-like copper-binding protein
MVVLITAIAVAVTSLIAGCGSASAPASGQMIGVTEKDFQITTSVPRAVSGVVVLRVRNAGPDPHELIVAPQRVGGLPIRSDGLTVAEAAIESSEPGLLEPGQPGVTRDLRLHLAPGRYVLFCNMEGHYMAGMKTELVVAG